MRIDFKEFLRFYTKSHFKFGKSIFGRKASFAKKPFLAKKLYQIRQKAISVNVNFAAKSLRKNRKNIYLPILIKGKDKIVEVIIIIYSIFKWLWMLFQIHEFDWLTFSKLPFPTSLKIQFQIWNNISIDNKGHWKRVVRFYFKKYGQHLCIK